MPACSISELLADEVDCDRWVWLGSGVACIVVLGGICCLLGFYWDFFCLGARKSAHVEPKEQSKEADFPAVLRVESPNRQTECTGDYDLVPNKLVNGQPHWHKRGGGRWVYSGFDGRWYVCGAGTRDRKFESASGYIYNNKCHKGTMPHQLGSPWEWSGGSKWHRDPGITIALGEKETTRWGQSKAAEIVNAGKLYRSPSSQASWSDSGGTRSGKSDTSSNQGSNQGSHASTRSLLIKGAKQKSMAVFSSAVGVGKYAGKDNGSDISTQDAMNLDGDEIRTQHSHDSLSSPASSSLHLSGNYKRGSYPPSEVSDVSSCFGTGAEGKAVWKEPPKVLCVISPNGQPSCCGTYDLVWGERPNSHPLWKMRGSERYLYSGTTGRWCIGAADVREDKFQRSAGFISSSEPHCGVTPDRVTSIWKRWDNKSFIKDEGIAIIQLSERPSDKLDEQRNLGMTLDLRGAMTTEHFHQKLQLDDVAGVVV